MPPPFAGSLARLAGLGPLLDAERQRRESIRAERILQSPYGQHSPFGPRPGQFNLYENQLSDLQHATHDPPWFRRHLPRRHQQSQGPILPRIYNDDMSRRRHWRSPHAPIHFRMQPHEGSYNRPGLRRRIDDRYHTASQGHDYESELDIQDIDHIEPSEFFYDGDSNLELQGSFERRRSRNEFSRPFARNHRGYHHNGDDDEYQQYEGGMPRVYGQYPMDRHRTGLHRESPYDTMDAGYSDEL